jgi:hypothetical protein
METSKVSKTMVRIAVIDSDPLRFIGFRALLNSEPDFDLQIRFAGGNRYASRSRCHSSWLSSRKECHRGSDRHEGTSSQP